MKAVIVIIISLMLNLSSAAACDCLMYPIEQYLESVDLVFTGKVVELVEVEYEEEKVLPDFLDTLSNRDQYLAEFYPKRYYAKVLILNEINGNMVPNDTLFFVSDFTNCDPTYELNQDYFFLPIK